MLRVDEVGLEVELGKGQMHSTDQRWLSPNNDDSPRLDWHMHIHSLLV